MYLTNTNVYQSQYSVHEYCVDLFLVCVVWIYAPEHRIFFIQEHFNCLNYPGAVDFQHIVQNDNKVHEYS